MTPSDALRRRRFLIALVGLGMLVVGVIIGLYGIGLQISKGTLTWNLFIA